MSTPTPPSDAQVRRHRAPARRAESRGIEWNITKVHAPDVWALGLHRPGRRRRRRRHRLPVGPPGARRPTIAAGTAAAPTTTTTGTTRSTRAAARAARTRRRPATTTATARTRWARWSATTARATRSAWRPARSGSAAATWTRATARRRRYTECFQWFLAPTNLAGQNPDPSKAPDVINNSWGCPPDEGCTDATILQTVVENVRAAGIEVVASAGNDGSRPADDQQPARDLRRRPLRSARPTAPTTSPSFSSRGPVTIDGSGRHEARRLRARRRRPLERARQHLRPAERHEHGGAPRRRPRRAAALGGARPHRHARLDRARHHRLGEPPPTTETCGGVPAGTYPTTRTAGDASTRSRPSATADLGVAQTDSPDPTLAGMPVTYALTVSNSGPASPRRLADRHAVADRRHQLRDAVAGLLLAPAARRDLQPRRDRAGRPATVTLVVTPSGTGTITSAASVRGRRASIPTPTTTPGPSRRRSSPARFPHPRSTRSASVPPGTAGPDRGSTSGAGHSDTWTLTGARSTPDRAPPRSRSPRARPARRCSSSSSTRSPDATCPRRTRSSRSTSSTCRPRIPSTTSSTPWRGTASRPAAAAATTAPATPVNRDQMAVFLLKAEHGADYAAARHRDSSRTSPVRASPRLDRATLPPRRHRRLRRQRLLPDRSGHAGADGGVPAEDPLGPSLHVPPGATGIFGDVPVDRFAADWIEDLYGRGITGGCSASPAAVLPGQPEHARPDGGVSHEGVRPAVTPRPPASSIRRPWSTILTCTPNGGEPMKRSRSPARPRKFAAF